MAARNLGDLKIRSIVDCEIPESYKTLVELEDLFDKLDSSNVDIAANKILEHLSQNTLSSDYISYFLYNEINMNPKKAKSIVDVAEILLKQGNFELKERHLERADQNILRICLKDREFKDLISGAPVFNYEYTPSRIYNIKDPSTIFYDAVWDNFEDFRIKFNEKENARSKVIMRDLAELALKHGSVNVFKFLTLNGLELEHDDDLCQFAVESGNFELIRILVNHGFSFDYHLKDAIKHRHNDIADWLIENYECEFIPIFIAIDAFNTRAVNFLIENDIFNECDLLEMERCFRLAAEFVNKPIVKTLVAKYGERMCTDHGLVQSALLIFAAKCRDFGLMDYLIERGANFDIEKQFFNLSRDHPLLIAIKNNDMELFNYCIQHGAQLGGYCSAAIDYIIENRNIEMLNTLIKTKNIFSLLDCQTSIIKAIDAGALDVAAAFNKANLMFGRVFVYIAVNQNSIKTIEYLLSECSDKYKTYVYESLPYVAQRGTNQMLSYFLKLDGINVNAVDEEYGTALMGVIDRDNLPRALIILSIDGVDVNAKSADGMTALHIASNNGNKLIVERLLSVNGIDVNAQDSTGLTALMIAIKQGHKDIVTLLLSVDGIDINAKDKDNMTALLIATGNGDTNSVSRLLRANGIDVNAQDSTGRTALMIASRYNYIEIVKQLISTEGIDVNAINDRAETALLLASIECHTDIVKLLLSTDGIDVNAKTNDGRTALMIAAEKCHMDVFNLLLKADGIDFNAKDDKNETALMILVNSVSSKFGSNQVAEYLLSIDGIDINAEDLNIEKHE